MPTRLNSNPMALLLLLLSLLFKLEEVALFSSIYSFLFNFCEKRRSRVVRDARLWSRKSPESPVFSLQNRICFDSNIAL